MVLVESGSSRRLVYASIILLSVIALSWQLGFLLELGEMIVFVVVMIVFLIAPFILFSI
jgi:hypothetical protein